MAGAAAKATRAPGNARPLEARGQRVVLRAVTSGDVSALKALHGALFPVRYPDALYTHAVHADAALVRVAVVDGVLVGALVCRVDDTGDMYIVTLGVLAPYRELGIGGALLRHAVGVSARAAGTKRVYAHVQVGNDAGLRLYGRFGFVVRERVLNYYRRITPPHAFIVDKVVRAHK